MAFSLLRTLIALALGILMFVAILFAANALGALVSEEAPRTSLSVVTDRPVERGVSVAPQAAAGTVRLSHGTMTIPPDGLVYALELFHVALVLAASFVCLWLLRKAILSIAAGNPFGNESIQSMRILGLIQIALFVWLIVHEIMLQAIIVPRLLMPDGAAILSSIAWRKDGVENVQIDFTIDFALLATGLIALAVAEAFRIGAEYRDDSEAVV
jgi:hypothetical protein